MDAVPVQDHTQIFPLWASPDWNLITGMADDAIALHAAAERCGARPAVLPVLRAWRNPFAAPSDEGVDRQFKGKFDMGWNAMREQIFANQKRLGVIPQNTLLTPWPGDLPIWDSL